MSNHMLKIKFRPKFVTFMNPYTRAKKPNFIAQLTLEMKLTLFSMTLEMS